MTVHDIFVQALDLQRQGLTPRQIAARVLEIGQANGFTKIGEYGSLSRGTIELVFPVDGTIYFDGADWHYLRRSYSPRDTNAD